MFLFLDAFTYLKDVLGSLVRLAPDALHVHFGIAIFFAVALVVRGPRAFVTAFWVVLAVAVVAEVFDLLYDLELGRRLRWLNSLKDIFNAMIWPAAWMVFGTRIARLVRPEARGRAPADSWGDVRSGPSTAGAAPAGNPATWTGAPLGSPGLDPTGSEPRPPAGVHGLEGAGK